MLYRDPVNVPLQEKPDRVWVPVNGTQWASLIAIGTILALLVGCSSIMALATSTIHNGFSSTTEIDGDYDAEEAATCLVFLNIVEGLRTQGRSDEYITEYMDIPTVNANGFA